MDTDPADQLRPTDPVERAEQRASVVANALGSEMLRDGRPVHQQDGVDAINVSDEEAQRCRVAAARVLRDLAEYDGRPPSIADGTVSAELVVALRRLGDEFGPAGVANVAAELAGR